MLDVTSHCVGAFFLCVSEQSVKERKENNHDSSSETPPPAPLLQCKWASALFQRGDSCRFREANVPSTYPRLVIRLAVSFCLDSPMSLFFLTDYFLWAKLYQLKLSVHSRSSKAPVSLNLKPVNAVIEEFGNNMFSL